MPRLIGTASRSAEKRQVGQPIICSLSSKEHRPDLQAIPLERAAMTDYLRRCKAWMKLWLVKIETVRGGVNNLPDHCDRRLWTVAVEQAFGTVNHPFAAMMMGLVSGVVQTDAGIVDLQALNGILAALHGILPQDEIEGMLAAQMIGHGPSCGRG
jgi:hypothetical protein